MFNDDEIIKTARQPKIFYGWYILAVAMIGAFLAAGSSQIFMSVILKPLTGEFGWSRTAMTGAITIGTITAGVFSFPVGRLADQYGPRMLTFLGALTAAVVYVAATQIDALWQFYVFYVVLRVVSMNILISIVPRTAMVNWFYRLRGRALGLIAMANPLGASVLVIVAQLIMESHGWRGVFVALALATVFFNALPAALILRQKPEDLGLFPDGFAGRHKRTGRSAIPVDPGNFEWTLKQAIRTRELWLIIAAIVVVMMVVTGVGFHLVAYFTDIGIGARDAVAAVSVYALIGALSNVLWGFLSEKFSERHLACGAMILSALTILYLQSVQNTMEAFIFAVLFGLAVRGEGSLLYIILAQYYGRRSYGAISGFVNPFYMIGLGFGPLVTSFSFDFFGSYQVAFNIFAAGSLIAAGFLWLAKKPVPVG